MTLLSFLFFTGLVIILTWWFTRASDLNTDEGYFLAGRSLTGIFIAGSLLLTNLSTEQLIGLNAGSFNDGLSVMCWEVIAGMSLVVLALVFSNVVTIAMPRLAAGEIDSLPEYAKQYAGMFHFTALANVRTVTTGNRTDYLLDRFGVGISMKINGQLIVVTPGTANQLGLKLGMIERGILKGNEKDLNGITQVARTSRMIIFDVPTNMLVDDKHKKQILRYFVWASPASGKLGILVWALNDTKSDRYTIACNNMQLLPPNYTEDRAIHVSKGPLLSNIPTANRFALVKIPQGTAVPFSPKMRTVATLKTINVENLHTMMAGVSESLAMVPDPQQASIQPATRK